MYKADYSIKLLTIVGCYRPTNYSCSKRKILYYIYTTIVIIILFSFNITLGGYFLLHSLNDIDEFAESLCWFLSTSICCAKMVNFLLRRNDVAKLLSTLGENTLRTRDNCEMMIQEKCDTTARRGTKYFFIICFITVSTVTFGGLAKGKNNISLPLKASYPYDGNFCLSYVSQSISIYIGAFISIGSETFVMTMMIQLCSQLNIVYYRLQNLSSLDKMNRNSRSTFRKSETKIIKNCVQHHNFIYSFSIKLNNIFNIVFGIQFFGAVLNICTLIYSLSTKTEINDKFVIQSMALTTFLFQIFLYCHFGNEVMVTSLKLAKVIDKIEWTVLEKSTKKDLLFISLRASRPVIMKCGLIIPITYDTFLSILRTSYTTYNLMKTINA